MRIERRVWMLSAAAALLYGLIAAAVNHGHGLGAMLRAGGAQGLSSALTTFALSALIDLGHQALARHGRTGVPASAAVVALAVTCATAQHLAINLLAGTPELLATVALPVAAAFVYGVVYALAVHRRRAGSAGPTGPGMVARLAVAD